MIDLTGSSQTPQYVSLGLLPAWQCCHYHEPPHCTYEHYDSKHTGRQNKALEVCQDPGNYNFCCFPFFTNNLHQIWRQYFDQNEISCLPFPFCLLEMIMNLFMIIIKCMVKKKVNESAIQMQELGILGNENEKAYLGLVKKLCGRYIQMKNRRKGKKSVEKCRQVQTSVDKCRQVQTSLDKFRQVQTSVDECRQVQTSAVNVLVQSRNVEKCRKCRKLENQKSWCRLVYVGVGQ